MYTLKQIAEMAGITAQSAGRYLRKHRVEPSRKQGSTMFFSEDDIKPALDHWRKRKNATSSPKQNNTETADTGKLFKLLSSQLAEKDEQLSAKDKQIADLNAHITELQASAKRREQEYDRQQQLQAATLIQLEQSQQRLAEIESKQEPKPEKRAGFWARLFHRREK